MRIRWKPKEESTIVRVGYHSRWANTSSESIDYKSNVFVRLLPIIFFITYLNFTVFLFAYGPWPYPVVDGTKLYVFIGLAHLALLTGYISRAFVKPGGYRLKLDVRHLLLVSIIVNALMFFPTSLFRTGSLIPNIVAGLRNPGESYAASGLMRQDGTPMTEYVRCILGVPIFILLPLTTYYWTRISPALRIGGVINLIGIVALFIAMGTNKAIADIVLLVPWILLAGHLSGQQRLSRRLIIRSCMIGIIAFGLFLTFLSIGQATRPGSGSLTGYFTATHTHADYDNLMVRYLPRMAQVGVLALTSYISHGYYALYLSLDKPFTPMFGFGNSMFLYRQAARITGNDSIEEMPYPVRIQEDGWNAYGLWSTIYPWIASDVSFPGTIVVVFLIGQGFALSWIDVLHGKNPFAVAMFAQFITMLYYFSGNNQCMQGGEALTAFWGTLFLWLMTRKKYLWRRTAQ